MKKYIIFIFLISAILLTSTGCKKIERGSILQDNLDVYYVKTVYYQQPFAVLMDSEKKDEHHVIFATDPDVDLNAEEYSVEQEPNTVFSYTFSDEDYNKYINGLPIFEGTFDAYTIVIPNKEDNNARYYTVLADFGDDIKNVIRKALKEDYTELPFNEDYLKQWKFIWYKYQ